MTKFTKRVSALLMVLLALASRAVAADPVAFEIFENFDDASHFTTSTTVPDGWLSEGTCAPYRSVGGINGTGYTAYSGDYVMHSQFGYSGRNEQLYTPMMSLAGGKEATISFQLLAPGGSPSIFYTLVNVKAGTAQTIEAQTYDLGTTSTTYTDWTKLTFTFTPETDGEYCFSINLSLAQSHMPSYNPGNVGIDDVLITGFEPAEGGGDVPPTEDNTVAFEATETFDDASHFTTSTTIPDGWLSIGTTPAARAVASLYETGYDAHSGTYILNSLDNVTDARDEVIFTPMMSLAGGKEATISLYVYAPGFTQGPLKGYTLATVKAGTAQTIEAQTIEVGSIDAQYTTWEQVSFAFTPETDGEYCFSIALKESTTLDRDHGCFGIDDVTITGYQPAPSTPVVVYDFEEYENEYEVIHTTPAGVSHVDGVLTVANNREYKIMFPGENNLTDFTVSVDIDVTTARQTNAGLYILASNALPENDKIHAVNVHLEKPANSNSVTPRLFSFKNGWDKTLKSGTAFTTDKEWCNVKAVVKGRDIKVYIDNSETPAIEYTLEEDRAGGIGLRSQAMASRFDNLTIISDEYKKVDVVAPDLTMGGELTTYNFDNEGIEFEVTGDVLQYFSRANGHIDVNYRHHPKIIFPSKTLLEEFAASVDIDITVTPDKIVNSGFYLFANNPRNGNDFIDAYNVQLSRAANGNTFRINLYQFHSVEGYKGCPVSGYDFTVDEGKTFITLKVVVKDNILYAFADDNTRPSIQYTLPAGLSGNIGLRSAGVVSRFDNVTIQSPQYEAQELYYVGGEKVVYGFEIEEYEYEVYSPTPEGVERINGQLSIDNTTEHKVIFPSETPLEEFNVSVDIDLNANNRFVNSGLYLFANNAQTNPDFISALNPQVERVNSTQAETNFINGLHKFDATTGYVTPSTFYQEYVTDKDVVTLRAIARNNMLYVFYDDMIIPSYSYELTEGMSGDVGIRSNRIAGQFDNFTIQSPQYSKKLPTAIEEVKADENAEKKTGVAYDLMGRRVNQPLKPGLYIIDGEKVVVRKDMR